MTKAGLPLFLLALPFLLVAQKQLIQSQILDTEGNGVPFAAIGILDKNFGAIAFEDGSFEIQVKEEYMEDTLVVAAIGYERRKVLYRDFVVEAPPTISVKQKVQELKQVTITPDGLDFQRLGEKKKSSSSTLSFFAPQKGTTMAVLLNEESRLMQVKNITVSVEKANLEFFQLRAMIFSVGADTLPDRQLLNESLIQNSKDKKGRLTFELTEYFWTDEPFYVGFEWIVSKEQFERIEKVKNDHPLSFIQGIEEKYPDLKFSISGQDAVLLRNLAGNLVERIELTDEQQEEVKERDKVNPKVLFQIHYKDEGLKTVSGSYISGNWRAFPFHSLVSVWAGVDKDN